MSRYTLIVAALLLADAGIWAAQQRPDFSGERILNRQASTLSSAMSGVQSGTQRIEHNEPSIRVHLTLVTDGKPFETKVDRFTDGREVAGKSGVSSFRWDGNVLVFNARAQGQNCEGSVSIRYELEDSGRRIRATETIRGCGRDQDNIWVFERP